MLHGPVVRGPALKIREVLPIVIELYAATFKEYLQQQCERAAARPDEYVWQANLRRQKHSGERLKRRTDELVDHSFPDVDGVDTDAMESVACAANKPEIQLCAAFAEEMAKVALDFLCLPARGNCRVSRLRIMSVESTGRSGQRAGAHTCQHGQSVRNGSGALGIDGDTELFLARCDDRMLHLACPVKVVASDAEDCDGDGRALYVHVVPEATVRVVRVRGLPVLPLNFDNCEVSGAVSDVSQAHIEMILQWIPRCDQIELLPELLAALSVLHAQENAERARLSAAECS